MTLDLWPHQIPAVEQAVEAFRGGVDLVVLDAPTGSGKTFISEAIRRELNLDGLYVCTSKQLQDQFLGDFPNDATLLKGRGNFPTANFPELFNHKSKYQQVSCADCAGNDCDLCPSRGDCPYLIAKREAAMSDLVCTNTYYFLNEANMVRDAVTSGRSFCTIDEADATEDILKSHIDVSISPGIQKRWGITFPSKKTVAGAWQDWFKETIPQLTHQLSMLGTPDSVRSRRTYNGLLRLIESLKLVDDDLDPDDPGWVLDGYQNGFINFKPVRVDHLAPDLLWRHAKKYLAMSATIGSPEQFIEDLGWDGPYEYVEVPSTQDVARRPVRVLPVAPVTRKTEADAWPKVAKALSVIIDHHPGERILVHTVSKRYAEYLYDALTSTNDRPVLTYLKSSDKDATIAEFESTKGAVLLAMSMERGYSGDDDACRVVVAAKFPWPFLDKQTRARKHQFGGKEWYNVRAGRELVQSLGRGVRHDNDFATQYILDSEFVRYYNGGRRPRSKDGKSRHRYLPAWFTDALQFEGDWKREIERAIRRN